MQPHPFAALRSTTLLFPFKSYRFSSSKSYSSLGTVQSGRELAAPFHFPLVTFYGLVPPPLFTLPVYIAALPPCKAALGRLTCVLSSNP